MDKQPRPATAAEERGVADTVRAEAHKGKSSHAATKDAAREAELARQKVIQEAVANADEPDPGEVHETTTPDPAPVRRSISWINPGNPGHDPETGKPV